MLLSSCLEMSELLTDLSSEELGFGRILGELGVVEVEVLPPGLHPRLTVHVDDRGLSTCHQLLGGSLIYSQTCSVCLHSTLWKTWSAVANTVAAQIEKCQTHWQVQCNERGACEDSAILRRCKARERVIKHPASPTLTERWTRPIRCWGKKLLPWFQNWRKRDQTLMARGGDGRDAKNAQVPERSCENCYFTIRFSKPAKRPRAKTWWSPGEVLGLNFK